MVYHHPLFNTPEITDIYLRQRMLQVTQQLVDLGLNKGTSGNCSVRNDAGYLITPSGVPPIEMVLGSMVCMDISGQVIGNGTPSSEWCFHRDILKNRPEINAVIHTHSMFATTLSCLHKDIPPFHYMIALAGGESIKCAPYSLFGSQALSDSALEALKGRKACLLANHGMIALGRDLDEALTISLEVEGLCEQYWRALQIGDPYILSKEQMSEVIDQFKGYGRWKNE